MASGVRSGNFCGVKVTLIVFQTLQLILAFVLIISSIVGLRNLDKQANDVTNISDLGNRDPLEKSHSGVGNQNSQHDLTLDVRETVSK